jgi:hypothetical protein
MSRSHPDHKEKKRDAAKARLNAALKTRFGLLSKSGPVDVGACGSQAPLIEVREPQYQ